MAGTGFPTVGWGAGGYGNLWHQAPWENHQDLFIWKDDFSKVLGSHDTKFGVLFSHNKKDEQPSGGSGIYTIQTDGAHRQRRHRPADQRPAASSSTPSFSART